MIKSFFYGVLIGFGRGLDFFFEKCYGFLIVALMNIYSFVMTDGGVMALFFAALMPIIWLCIAWDTKTGRITRVS